MLRPRSLIALRRARCSRPRTALRRHLHGRRARRSSTPATPARTRSRPSTPARRSASPASAALARRPGRHRARAPDGQSVVCPKTGDHAVVLNLGDGDDVAAVSRQRHPPGRLQRRRRQRRAVRRRRHRRLQRRRRQRQRRLPRRARRVRRLRHRQGHGDLRRRRHPDLVRADRGRRGPRRRPPSRRLRRHQPGDPSRRDRHARQRRRRELLRAPTRPTSTATATASPRPQDCDDGDPAIRPGAREIVGNASTRTATRASTPFPPLCGCSRNAWVAAGRRTVNTALRPRDFPRGTRIELRCSGPGCPFTGRASRAQVGRVRRTCTAPSAVAASGAAPRSRSASPARGGSAGVLRFRFGAPGTPRVDFLCLPPGGRVRDC